MALHLTGTLKAWDAATYKADVLLDGDTGNFLLAVPVARNIAGAEMTVGRAVALILWDPANTADALVYAVWTP